MQLCNWNKIKRLLNVDLPVSKSPDSSAGRWCERIDCSSWSIFKPHKLSLIGSGSRTLFNSDSPIRATITDQIRGITTHCRHEWSLLVMENGECRSRSFTVEGVKIASKDMSSCRLSSKLLYCSRSQVDEIVFHRWESSLIVVIESYFCFKHKTTKSSFKKPYFLDTVIFSLNRNQTPILYSNYFDWI